MEILEKYRLVAVKCSWDFSRCSCPVDIMYTIYTRKNLNVKFVLPQSQGTLFYVHSSKFGVTSVNLCYILCDGAVKSKRRCFYTS